MDTAAGQISRSDVAVAANRFGERIGDIVPMTGGLINETYRVSAGADAFILQRLNPSVFPDAEAVMDDIVTVTDHVVAPIVPRLRTSLEGDFGVVVGGATWRAWDVVADAAPVAVATPARVTSAAGLLARFHGRLDGLEPSDLHRRSVRFHDPARHLDHLQRAWRSDPVGRAGSARATFEALADHADLARVADELLGRWGVRIAHNDAKLANFLFRGDEAVCLVDLDTVAASAQFWDVADLVRTAADAAAEDEPDAARHRADAELVDAILEGYRRVRPAGGELEIGCVLIAYEQAIRFLADWIEGDRYWRTTTPTQNLDRARGQLALLASLRELFGT